LYDIYKVHKPADGEDDGACIEPTELDYCWSNTVESSNLRRFVLDVLSKTWQKHLIWYDYASWKVVLDKHSDPRDALLQRLGQEVSVLPVESYVDSDD
jgi:hypothetical protein